MAVTLTLEINIPGYAVFQLEHLVLDFNGTLSFNGKLISGVAETLTQLSSQLKVHVLTADTFGVAQDALAGVPCAVHVLVGQGLDEQKAMFVQQLGAEHVVAYGNGLNDRKMLKAARLGVVVAGREGCAVESLLAADVCIADIIDGLNLLLHTKRLEATLKI